MKTLRRYFIREFFKFFTIIILSFTAIAIVAEFFDKASEFFRHKPGISLVIQYLIYQTPRIMLYAVPFASLFSILIVVGIASKWREIVIIKASGISTRKLFSVFLVLGIIMTIVVVLLGETIVPAATRKAAWIRKVEILGDSLTILHREEAMWLKGLDRSIIRIDGFVEDQDRILKTSIFSFDSSFRLEKRIEAKEAVWKDGTWNLRDVQVFDFARKRDEKHDSYLSTSLEEPKIFREEMKKPQEMNFMELYAYYSRLEKAGFKNLKYVVRLYEKLAFPVVNFIMILVGLSLALNARWGGGIKAAGLGVLVSVSYWLVYSFSVSLGNTAILPPWMAPWLGPLLFGTAGSALYFQIRD